MIHVSRLDRAAAGSPIIREISLHVRSGEVVALAGRRSGRSTLLRHIAGLSVPDRGDVFIDGVSCATSSLAGADRLRRRIGYLADDDALSLDRDVRANLWESLRDAPGPLHAPMRLTWALRVTGLDERLLGSLPGALPAAVTRRLCIARAILHTPDILLLDSPLRGLGIADHTDILRTLNAARDALGATVVVALDELSAIPVVADRVVVLQAGRVTFDGDTTTFLESGIDLEPPACHQP